MGQRSIAGDTQRDRPGDPLKRPGLALHVHIDIDLEALASGLLSHSASSRPDRKAADRPWRVRFRAWEPVDTQRYGQSTASSAHRAWQYRGVLPQTGVPRS